MKKHKLLAVALVAVMILSGCNAVNVTTVASIGDTVMEKPEFMYYMQSGKSQAFQEAQKLGLSLDTDKDWKTVMLGDKTAAEYAKEKAMENVKVIMTMEAKGKEAGYVLTEADRQEMASQKEQIINQLGGRYGYEQALTEMGITLDALDTIVERSVYANAYMTKFTTENEGAFDATDEEAKAKYESDYVYVRHILISNQAPQEEMPENTEVVDEEAPADEPLVDYDAVAKEKAEGILKELAEGKDFIALMNEHSEDGRDENGKLASDGYVMTDNGQMVPEFEKAAMELEIGAYTTELVATDYGYHILMRYALPTSGEQYDAAIEEVKGTLSSEKLENQINAWAEELGFETNEKFYNALKVKVEG